MESVYEYLTIHGDANDFETQRDLWQQLEYEQVPAAHRDSRRTLQNHHFEQFVRLQRQHIRENDEKVSDRRAKLRAQCRDRWKDASSVRFDEVKTHYPSLFTKETFEEELKFLSVNENAGGDSMMSEAQLAQPQPQPCPRTPSTLHSYQKPPGEGGMAPHLNQHDQVVPRQQPPPPHLSSLFRKKPSEQEEEENFHPNHPVARRNPFQTAGEKLQRDRLLGKADQDEHQSNSAGGVRRGPQGSLGKRPYHPINQDLLLGSNQHDNDESAINKKFVSPTLQKGANGKTSRPGGTTNGNKSAGAAAQDDEDMDPRLKSCDPELISKIELEIVDYGDPVKFDDIAGLQFAKKCVNELVIWPMARPDIFTGLRSLPKGLLLFGPPGTGKTLIGKAIASESGATFFSISASSLTSKWIGEGEKLVRTLFAVAAVKQPSVIFIDEIDSLLTQRSSEENEASRRMKTEFLVQLDGAGTKAKDVILVVGATNRPQELDEAARRRFVKRLYIPLPSFEARLDMVNRLLKGNKHSLSDEDKTFIANKTKGYSGADVRALCTEAAMEPIRSCTDIRTMDADSVRPINLDDFVVALRGVRSSVAAKDLDFYRDWNEEFGSFPFECHEAS